MGWLVVEVAVGLLWFISYTTSLLCYLLLSGFSNHSITCSFTVHIGVHFGEFSFPIQVLVPSEKNRFALFPISLGSVGSSV